MEADNNIEPETDAALAAYRWIKGLTILANGESALLGDAEPPRQPTIYDTTVTDQKAALDGRDPVPVPGLRLTLRAGGPDGQEVAVDGVILGLGDYRFTYMDDTLYLDLSVGPQTFGDRIGFYRMARISFAPSGRTFGGSVNRISPTKFVAYLWDGVVVPGG